VDVITAIPGTTDEELVNRCRCGDVDAFSLLHSRYEQKLFRYAYLMSGSREDSCDIVQDTFIKAYKAIGRFRGDSSIITWLMRICTNLCRTHARSKMFKALKLSEIAVFRDFKMAEEQLNPVISVEKRLEADSIRDLLLKLPAHQRELLVLYEYEELSTDEIARLQNTSPGSVRVRLFRARQHLKEIALKTLAHM